MEGKKLICADYDGMGNYGRFPKRSVTVKKKRLASFIKEMISLKKKSEAIVK